MAAHRCLSAVAFQSLLLLTVNAGAQDLAIVGRVTSGGKIEALSPGRMSVRTADGELRVVRYQQPGRNSVELKDGRPVRMETSFQVVGELPVETLKPGDQVRCRVTISRRGAIDGVVDELTLVDAGKPGLVFDSPPASAREKAPGVLTAELVKLGKSKLTVRVPKSEDLTRGQVALRLAKGAKLLADLRRIDRVRPGDEVIDLLAARLNTGDIVARQMTVRLSGKATRGVSMEDKLARKHRKLSDEPSAPRDVRSRNFLLHTDLSDRNAAILLDKLERMAGLISRYFGAAPRGVIECYVVRDLNQWTGAKIPANARAKILEPAGVTLSRSLGKQRESIVYSCADHGVAQHEAVHAFCYLAFGSTGPTWYAEGMAEMGQYWKADQKGVDVNPSVMRYLKQSEPKQLAEIVKAGQVTGDSWQAYAWRWALCHLLANNPNYSDRFLGLGVNLMRKRGQTFESVYGPVARQLSFEYDQFCEHVDNGYRADLCAWPWGEKFRPLSGSRVVKQSVRADRGWQATGGRVEQGVAYQLAAQGTWRTATAAAPVTADGDPAGPGRLMGVVLSSFEQGRYALGKPFELGEKFEFTAPATGDLYVRCRDAWNELSDNRGELTLHLRKASKSTP